MRAAIARTVAAFAIALVSVGLTVSQAGFAAVGGGIGVLVGVPGAVVELVRAVLPIVVALLLAALLIRFGIRALRAGVSFAGDIARGGKLLAVTAWAAFAWLVVELLYRQFWLGWATLFGSLGASLVWSSAVLALCFIAERLLPWSRAPQGVRKLGFLVVVSLALLTAWAAWSHRDVVARLALLPVALAGLGLAASGVQRVETDERARTLVELGLASLLLSGPVGSFLS